MSTKLTTMTADALEARGARTFTRYKVFVGFPVAVFASGLLGAAPLAGGILGLLNFGPLGGVLGMMLGVSGSLVAMSRIALVGNAALRNSIAAKLGLAGTSAHFVGICEPKNNRAISARLDTDDNVGFLRWTKTHLTVTTEGSVLVLPQSEIYGFETEPVAALPYLPWIRVIFDRPSGRESFLLMSREATTIVKQRRATLDLYAQLVEWHADHQLAWLEAQTDRDE